MFIYVFDKLDKDKLISLGYKFVCTNDVGNKKAYVFENNSKLNFDNCNVKVHRTNKLYFG